MGDMVDNFEKTLMLVSPVKEGLGLSVLDRSCGDDDRGDIFFSELAALQAKKEAEAARGASGCCGSLSIGEVRHSRAAAALGVSPTIRVWRLLCQNGPPDCFVVDSHPYPK